jgi:hypothetical protein
MVFTWWWRQPPLVPPWLIVVCVTLIELLALSLIFIWARALDHPAVLVFDDEIVWNETHKERQLRAPFPTVVIDTCESTRQWIVRAPAFSEKTLALPMEAVPRLADDISALQGLERSQARPT